MPTTSLPMLAGVTSTVIFAASALPMLVKAWRTRDLASYSRGNLLLANLGNAVHSIYVYSMPVGPIWLLHTFYLISSALMLLWSVRYGAMRRRSATTRADQRTSPTTSVSRPWHHSAQRAAANQYQRGQIPPSGDPAWPHVGVLLWSHLRSPVRPQQVQGEDTQPCLSPEHGQLVRPG